MISIRHSYGNSMLVLITYDVNTQSASGRHRLNKIAKICTNYGQRVQNSVFECNLDAAQFHLVKEKILDVYDEEEDSIRFYNLGENYSGKVLHYGIKDSFDLNGSLIL